MEQIIQKAIEGGYKDLLSFKSENAFWIVCNTKEKTFIEDEHCETKKVNVTFTERKEAIVLDPLFWQALGKACGWTGYECLDCGTKHFGQYGYSDCCQTWSSAKSRDRWQYEALLFHEINLTEGWDAAVKYLSELIK